MARLVKKLFTATGGTPWTVPAGVTRIWTYGVGGGGGGGGGATGSTGSTVVEAGGGGGGGAGAAFGQWLDVTPGEVLTITAGTLGGGGSTNIFIGGNPGSDGASGGDSSIVNAGGTIRLFWTGGLGGKGGLVAAGAAGGGRNWHVATETNLDRNGSLFLAPGYGGVGHFASATTYGQAREGQFAGMCSARAYFSAAGQTGLYPGASGSYKGGGAGGGGGFADWPLLSSNVPGYPGYGGSGGIPNNAGPAIQDGSPGGDATGFGNGGGGGGGGACASGSASYGGGGGLGAIGAVMIVWVE